MKRILRIILIAFSILIILMQFSFANEVPLRTDVAGNNLQNQAQAWQDEGTGQTESNTGEQSSHKLENTTNSLATIGDVLGWVVIIIPYTVNKLLTIATTGGTNDTFSIQDLLLGNYDLFNIDFFNAQSLNGTHSELIKKLSDSVAVWYIAVRNLAVIGCAIILIYVGIRMAISTTSEDSAKYKIMLKNWTVGLVLLFLLHYIVIALLFIANLFIDFIKNFISSTTSTTTGMEETILNNAFVEIVNQEGMNKLLYIILYFMLVYYQLKFFIMYIMRVLKVAFLMMISPLICMTYSIDTMGDNKAQAFNNWIKQMLIEIFVQPIHLSIYIVFIYSAGAIAEVVPLIAIIFLAALSNGEKIVRRAFRVEGKGLKDIKFKKV